MEASSFDEANVALAAPAGMETDCTSLSVFRGVDQKGYPVVVSAWKLTEEEIKDLLAGKRLWLIINGVTMPPVALTMKKLFGE